MLSSSPAFLFHFHSVISSFLTAVNLDLGFPFLKPLDERQRVAGPWASLGLCCAERWSHCVSVTDSPGLGVRLARIPPLPLAVCSQESYSTSLSLLYSLSFSWPPQNSLVVTRINYTNPVPGMPVSNKINMVTTTLHTIFKNYSLATPVNQHQRLWKRGSLLGDQVAERQAAGATFSSCVLPDSPSTLLFPERMPV